MATGCSTQVMMLLLCHPSSDPLLPKKKKKKKFALEKKPFQQNIFLASCHAHFLCFWRRKEPTEQTREDTEGKTHQQLCKYWGEGSYGTPQLSYTLAEGCPTAPKHPQAPGKVSAMKFGAGLFRNHQGTGA